MSRSSTLLGLGAASLVAGCLWGDLLTTDAEVIFTTTAFDGFAHAVAGGFYGNANTHVDVAIGAFDSDTVFIYNDISATGTLGTTAAVTFTGPAGSEAGWSLTSGLAVGEGWTWLYPDLVIGAPNDNGGRGRVYVLDSGTMGSNIVSTGFIEFTGVSANEYAGWDVDLGDFNEDGYPDFLIGACGASSDAGRVYIVYGRDWVQGTVFDLSMADVIIDGDAGEQLGCTSEAGDVNGDGQDEIILGGRSADSGRGRVHVIYEVGLGTWDVDNIAGKVVFSSNDRTSQLGRSLAVGDFDGDGIDDLAMGAPDHWCHITGSCAPEAGSVYLKLGEPASLGNTITWSSGPVESEAEITFDGENNGDGFGSALTFVSDLNGDVYDDLAVGASGDDATYVWYGRPNGGTASFTSVKSGDADATVDGSALELSSGYSLADAGDINGDGESELLIGAPGYELTDYSFPFNGQAYLFGGEEYDTSSP